MSRKIELLAPAGDWEAFLAAIENGAGAVYLGGKLFNARQSASNFDNEQLKRAADYAHVRDANVYLTANTLITDDEMEQAVDFIGQAYLIGIDGIIVQDLGLAGVVKRLFPGLELHASTQMTIYNLEGVKALESLGFKRAVLARELSIAEISYITKNTPLEIEVFVHGALCICYSGQCFMSSIIGGRSGNRGKCAQPCRLPYQLVDEKGNKHNKQEYLLSPKDLCSVEMLGNIVKSGVTSFKIEGRMKTPEYVATVVRTYRKYLDSIQDISQEDACDLHIENEDMKSLTQIFNRGGFSKGYLNGKTGRDMMCYEKPKNWGAFLGQAISYNESQKTVRLRLEDELGLGDGIEVWNGENESPGAVVSEIKVSGVAKERAFAGQIADIGRLKGSISKGNKVYKTSDKLLNAAARRSFESGYQRKLDVFARMAIRDEKPAVLTVWDNAGNETAVESGRPTEKAVNKPLTRERILEQLNKTGSTPFQFENIEIELEENLSMPASEINNMRRLALEGLERKRTDKYFRRIPEAFIEKKEKLLYFPGNSRNTSNKPGISLYLYNTIPNNDYTGLDIDRLCLPINLLQGKEAINLVKSYRDKGTEVFCSLPSITRGNYDRLIRSKLGSLLDMGVDGFLIGNIGSVELIKSFGDVKIIGDYSLNVLNSRTGKELLDLGLKGQTLSIEVTLKQVMEHKDCDGMEKEVIVYGRLPLMTSEYCPVGSVKGNFRAGSKCSGVCEECHFRLKDRKGMEFPVLCDRIDCRSTILNSNVLFVPEVVDKLRNSNVNNIRLMIYDESPEEIKAVVKLHRRIIEQGLKTAGQINELIDEIKSRGFTKGHFFRGV